MGSGPENKESPNQSEKKPVQRPDVRKPLGGTALGGSGVKKPGK